MNFNEYQKSEEIRRNKIWKTLTPSMQHFILMYAFRLRTDFEHIEHYVETNKFRESKLTFDDLPGFIQTMSPQQLREEAYHVIGMGAKLRELA